MIIRILICLAIGYVFGCFQTGYIYGKSKGIDIRRHGSGNAGTTNTLRVLGKKAGYITFAGDCLKAIAALLLVRFVLFPQAPHLQELLLITGLGVVLGHNYPFFLNFRGGKGIAATAGVMIAFDIRFLIPGLIAFFLVFFLTRYVSLGSLVLSILLPFLVLIFYPGRIALLLLTLIYTAMAFWRHRANIKRLINGTENRFDKKKKGGKQS